MNIFKEKKIILLSKVRYKGNWYQICSNKLGERFYLKIENNEYKNLNIKEYLELNKIFNKKFDGKYYNMKKYDGNFRLVIIVGLELITLSSLALEYNNYIDSSGYAKNT